MTYLTTEKSSVKITVPEIISRKQSGVKIAALTAYDVGMGSLIDEAGIDLILVGDSVGCVVQGHSTTLPVTLDEMVYHCRCVARGINHALLVGDMPFLSYQPSIERAIESAGRLLKEGGVSAVKLEGGLAVADIIKRLVDFDIPVVGHVGLTPQSYHRMGGHKIQGKSHSDTGGNEAGTAERILADACAVADAGAFAIVIEGVPACLGREITQMVRVPTIGIGAGPDCDGQILVTHDMLGLLAGKPPRFVKQYVQLREQAQTAVKEFIQEVREGVFPEPTK